MPRLREKSRNLGSPESCRNPEKKLKIVNPKPISDTAVRAQDMSVRRLERSVRIQENTSAMGGSPGRDATSSDTAVTLYQPEITLAAGCYGCGNLPALFATIRSTLYLISFVPVSAINWTFCTTRAAPVGNSCAWRGARHAQDQRKSKHQASIKLRRVHRNLLSWSHGHRSWLIGAWPERQPGGAHHVPRASCCLLALALLLLAGAAERADEGVLASFDTGARPVPALARAALRAVTTRVARDPAEPERLVLDRIRGDRLAAQHRRHPVRPPRPRACAAGWAPRRPACSGAQSLAHPSRSPSWRLLALAGALVDLVGAAQRLHRHRTQRRLHQRLLALVDAATAPGALLALARRSSPACRCCTSGPGVCTPSPAGSRR